ncbi:hypothetical protein E2C01_075608 [Portunus trituberculatus]|uniref:Uncharacterized protein n=1 Tax=Portunus trituberculatus TaxID=210409 RepID=A0A5B7IHH7_PORTR|nr:hypothetical protein [Portunus trituberculatus]
MPCVPCGWSVEGGAGRVPASVDGTRLVTVNNASTPSVCSFAADCSWRAGTGHLPLMKEAVAWPACSVGVRTSSHHPDPLRRG